MIALYLALAWCALSLLFAWLWSTIRAAQAIHGESQPPAQPTALAEFVDVYQARLSDEELRRHQDLIALRYVLGDALARRMGHRVPQARA